MSITLGITLSRPDRIPGLNRKDGPGMNRGITAIKVGDRGFIRGPVIGLATEPRQLRRTKP